MIKIVIPDSGPLISLSYANALDLLFCFKSEVQVVLTDIVEYEVSSERDRFPDAEKTFQFLSKHAGHVVTEKTTFGEAALFRVKMDSHYQLPDDAGEVSIASFNINSNEKTIVLFEDHWFLDESRFKSSTNRVSTLSFIKNVFDNNLITKKRYAEITATLKSIQRSKLLFESSKDWRESLQK
ncbi:hypothetical protein [Methyloprofundus sp.]|uniref:hypothetical protein n=1 Tax=Methyloprofundus sp. TaxID=2020875 RepID=UPI003D0A5819